MLKIYLLIRSSVSIHNWQFGWNNISKFRLQSPQNFKRYVITKTMFKMFLFSVLWSRQQYEAGVVTQISKINCNPRGSSSVVAVQNVWGDKTRSPLEKLRVFLLTCVTVSILTAPDAFKLSSTFWYIDTPLTREYSLDQTRLFGRHAQSKDRSDYQLANFLFVLTLHNHRAEKR